MAEKLYRVNTPKRQPFLQQKGAITKGVASDLG